MMKKRIFVGIFFFLHEICLRISLIFSRILLFHNNHHSSILPWSVCYMNIWNVCSYNLSRPSQIIQFLIRHILLTSYVHYSPHLILLLFFCYILYWESQSVPRFLWVKCREDEMRKKRYKFFSVGSYFKTLRSSRDVVYKFWFIKIYFFFLHLKAFLLDSKIPLLNWIWI
jgi:hypothetical protein